jgi:hypothetical protein
MTVDDIKKQSIDWEKSLEASWGSTIFSVVLLCISVLLMFGGWWLGPMLMFLVGLVVGTASSYFLIDHIFNASGWSNCWVMGIGSIVGGLLVGFVLLRMIDLGIFCLGAALGGVLGYWFYGIVLQKVTTTVVLGYDALFWVCVIISALIFGLIAAKLERNLIILTTSVCGAFLFTLSVDQLFLGGGHFNLSQFQQDHTKHTRDDDIFYVLAASWALLAVISMGLQRHLSDRHKNRADGEVDVVYVQAEPRQNRTYFSV